MSAATRWLLSIVTVAACSSHDAPPAIGSAASSANPATPSDGYAADSLGALSFAVSDGTPQARQHFARGLLALHSFWYDEATRQFQAAIDADPTLRMAYWGAAMSRCKLLWGEDDLTGARQMLARMPDPDGLSPREQAWVLAAVELLAEGDVRSSRKRFAAAMETVHTQFPDDESATFLAAALLAATRPEDPDYLFVRLRAAGLALGVFQHNPKHPGAAHYAIHALDTAAFAPVALPLALAYAQIAPAAFHARHMPAHIFSRLAMWQAATASCQAAWDISVATARRDNLSADHDDFHSLSWLVELSFERGRRKDAEAALHVFAEAVRAGLSHQPRSMYADEVLSYIMHTGEWSRVDELLAPLAMPAVDDASPSALFETMSVLRARARAAAEQRDLATTKRLVADMDALHPKLRPLLLGGSCHGHQAKQAVDKIDHAQVRRRQALLARAAGNDAALVKILREAVADANEDAGESIQPGLLLHEEIADALARLGRPNDAAGEYAIALGQHPGRAYSLLGIARALTQAGFPDAARARYQQLLVFWSAADAETGGLAEARAAVARTP